MEIGICVEAQNIQTREIRHTNNFYFIMVAGDQNSKTTQISPLKLSSQLKQCRFDAALRRKKRRLQIN